MNALARLRTVGLALSARSKPLTATPLRTSADLAGWHYRKPRLEVPKRDSLIADGMMTMMWYWVLFHCWYDSGHLIGHFPYPDPSKWTDAELGIPPDSED